MKGGICLKCEECQKLLWDFDDCSEDEQKRILEHLNSCPECRETLALIQKVQNSDVPAPLSVADKTIARLEKEKKPLYSSFLKYSLAASVVIVASLIFLLPTIRPKTADNAENASLDYKAESTVADGVATGTVWFDDMLFGVAESEDMVEDCAPEAEAPTSEEFSKNEPVTAPEVPRDEPMEVPEADEQMLINLYKDTFLISSHTADVVLSGVSEMRVMEILSSLSPEKIDAHIEIAGDALDMVITLLKEADVVPVYTTVSETVVKTIVYFEENLK